jgi:AmmeMemoRadiSam system protein B
MSATPDKILTSSLAGRWYDGDPAGLRAQLDSFFEAAAGQKKLENVRALILPHAGYDYSGPVAACGLHHVRGRRFSRVVVMGPTHRLPMPNTVSVPDAHRFRTILGDLPIDRDFLSALKKDYHFRSVPAAETGEHSVEIEFPLLQRALGDVRLAPLTVGQLDDRSIAEVAAALAAVIDDDTLVVVSSDFTHYGFNFDYVPFTRNLEANLKTLDLGAYAFIEKKDSAGFRDYVHRTGATICGRDPIAVLTALLDERDTVHLVKYDTSGRLTGDWSHTVSYLCAAVTRK